MYILGKLLQSDFLQDFLAFTFGIVVGVSNFAYQGATNIDMLSLLYVFISSGAALGFFKIIKKIYELWIERSDKKYIRSRQDLKENIEHIKEQQDRLIESLSKKDDIIREKDKIIRSKDKEVQDVYGKYTEILGRLNALEEN